MLSTLSERVRDSKEDQHGFTLIELLVVITILGILAAIVVFSVGGIGDKGQAAACKTDTVTLRTAEEAALAGVPTAQFPNLGAYVPMTATASTAPSLLNDGLLSQASTLHYVVLVPATGTTPATFQIFTTTSTATTPPCGGTTGTSSQVTAASSSSAAGPF